MEEEGLTRREKNILGYVGVFFSQISFLVLAFLAYKYESNIFMSGVFIGSFISICFFEYNDFKRFKESKK